MSDEHIGPCGKYCAVVDECDARGHEITRLRADLAAERERVLNMQVSLIRFLEKRCDDTEELAAIQSEIDKLRELLREAREHIDSLASRLDDHDRGMALDYDLYARIDAKLNGGRG